MYPSKYRFLNFDISPYPLPHNDEYLFLMAKQWHVALPWEADFEDNDEKEVYTKQFEAFLDYLRSTLQKDIESGKYRDYIITDTDGSFVGVTDVGTIFFDKPEVGIILAEKYRGRKIGYSIMKDFIQRVKKCMDTDKVIWRSEKDNIAGICLALKLGGRECFVADGYLFFEI